MTKPYKARRHFIHDLGVLAISIVVAVLLAKSGIITSLLNRTVGWEILGALIAGFFFTSMFTTPPAIVALAQISATNSLWLTALFGACGAMLGDFILFKFFRDEVAQDLEYLAKVTNASRLTHIFRLKLFRWVMPFIGAIIISSPLPDELGLAMLGLSHVSTKKFFPIVFVFNFIGIVILGLVARAI